MVSEIVEVTIHRDFADVTCDFVFRNGGPTTVVRMGFPDYDDHADTADKLTSTFDYFRSYVGGKRVRTRLEAVDVKDTDNPQTTHREAFQVKSVQFGSHQTVRVREVYRQPLGSIALWGEVKGKGTPAYNVFSYIFATGATWKGSIARAEMRITFARDSYAGSKVVLRERPDLDDTKEAGAHRMWDWWAANPHAVCGAEDFAVRGRTLRLVKRNWRPSEDDDVSIAFGYYYRKV